MCMYMRASGNDIVAYVGCVKSLGLAVQFMHGLARFMRIIIIVFVISHSCLDLIEF